MIRNLIAITLLISIAGTSIAETNYDDAANSVDTSSASQGAGNDNSIASVNDNATQPTIQDNTIDSAPQPPETSSLANVEAFRDMANVAPGDFQACESMRRDCGEGNPVCEQMTFQCNQGAQQRMTSN